MARILIVDDEPDNVTILQKFLTFSGYQTVAARNGAAGLEVLGRERIDLVLLDLMMPGMGGYEVTRRIRGNDGTRDLPIIIVSAKGQTEDVTTGLDMGANDYVTKPIVMEELLARVRTHLRLKEAQDRLAAANNELRELSELKGRLVSVVSHELRTPLTSIRAALDLVRKRLEPKAQDRALELVDISLRNTDRLIRLVNDVLDFSRIEKAGLDIRIEPVNLKTVIRYVLEELNAIVEPGSTMLESSIPELIPEVQGDADRVQQVLVNLVANAIKFSARGTRITVGVDAPVEGMVRVWVRDEGTGISVENQARLFTPFQQFARPVQRLGGGTGLGLAICREIIIRHGGQLGVVSEPGMGSTFYFTLSCVAEPS